MATDKFRGIGAHLKDVWRGTASKKVYGIYILVPLAIYWAGVAISAAVYPGGFSMLTVYVSYLGGYPNNPNGYIIYNTLTFIAGILLAPHFFYLYRRLMPTLKVFSVLSGFFGIVGAFGLATLGFWYQGVPGPWHAVATYLAFGGLGAGLTFAFFVFLRKLWLRQPWPKWWQIAILYGIILAIVGVATLFTNATNLLQGLNVNPAFLEDRFWEWFYLFAVLIGIIGVYLIAPSEVGTSVSKDKSGRNG